MSGCSGWEHDTCMGDIHPQTVDAIKAEERERVLALVRNALEQESPGWVDREPELDVLLTRIAEGATQIP